MATKLGGVIVLHKALSGLVPSKTQRQKPNLKAWAQEQKRHIEEMDRLDSEIPLPGEKTRGFVFRR